MRAKDVLMGGAVDVKRRLILMTGAIDQKEQGILVRVPVPEPGIWTFIKAETNMTDDAWAAWQVTFGGPFRIPRRESQRYAASRQFKKAEYIQDRNAVMFYDGEVRPGDCVLKMWTVEVVGKKGIITFGPDSHSRLSGRVTKSYLMSAVRKGFGEGDAVTEVTLPMRKIR